MHNIVPHYSTLPYKAYFCITAVLENTLENTPSSTTKCWIGVGSVLDQRWISVESQHDQELIPFEHRQFNIQHPRRQRTSTVRSVLYQVSQHSLLLSVLCGARRQDRINTRGPRDSNGPGQGVVVESVVISGVSS